MPFSALGLSAPLTRALTARHYVMPTPVQAEAIPTILRGGDVWAQAQTGSGKTAAFALPILEHLSAQDRPAGRTISILVLVPTRELAAQVTESFQHYGEHLPISPKIITAVGGVSINPQMMDLRGGADIVVATPGRLIDLVEKNALKLDAVETLVLDEADQLFALGFAVELGRILGLLPRRRQNLLFSATFPKEVTALANELLHEPHRIAIEAAPETTPDIVERAIEVDAPRRTQLLNHLIVENDWARVLIFVATKYSTGHVAEKLRRLGIDAGELHGELSQGARTRTLAEFHEGKITALVATDLAARGLDFEKLPVVVNYDLPRSAIVYTHRIGRTGRAGESGEAVSFVSASTFAHFQLIEKRHESPISREQIPGFEPAMVMAAPPPASGGVKGKRKSKKDKLREAAGLAPGQPLNDPRQPAKPKPKPAARPQVSARPHPRPAPKPRRAPPKRSDPAPDNSAFDEKPSSFSWRRVDRNQHGLR
ncbi:MAG: DEAD/DEAH box helicase [Opitutaceae bacterium]|nr:DEAD/DEAH box helicase [Opitutaceae bacterium]